MPGTEAQTFLLLPLRGLGYSLGTFDSISEALSSHGGLFLIAAEPVPSWNSSQQGQCPQALCKGFPFCVTESSCDKC